MYKTAIAHVEGELSYDEALNNFKTAYPEYNVRAVKQSNFGWIAFIQKEAYQDQNVQDGIPAEMDESQSPGADVGMLEIEMGEGPEETYGEEEEKQEGLMEKLEDALNEVERLVSEIKDSEEDEEEVRPFDTPEEMDDELDLEEEGFEKEMPMMIEREKEAGVTFKSAAREVEQLLKIEKEFRGYKLASVEEKKNSFVAKLVKK
jgi:hypothetical protein